MSDINFEIIPLRITNTDQALKGKDIFYKCKLCDGVIPSEPKDNVGCECGNIFIDIDYFRLVIRDYRKLEFLRKVKK